MKNSLLSLLLLLACSFLHAQTALQGLVLGADKKEGLAGVNVYLANSSTGTITDEKGNFIIRNFPAGRYDLVISCIGYTTQVITIVSSQLPPSLTVTLQPKVEELQEVVVEPYEKNGWEKWGSFFMENFIGTHAFAMDCKLKNRDAVKFRFSKKKNTLRAISTEQLVMENRALGYTLRYDLVNFEYNFGTRILLYQGYPLFEEMETKRSGLQKRWLRNREDVYYGSVMHFMRCLYRNKLLEEHFAVRRLIKISDEEKKRVKALYHAQVVNQAIESATLTVNSNGSAPLMRRDSAAYYRKVMNEPEELNILIDKVLTGDSLAYAIDSTTAGFEFPGYLQVVYTEKQTPPEYKKYLPKGVEHIPLTSEIFRTSQRALSVLSNGSYFEPTDMITSGYWGWSEKMATMLPSDYWPAPKNKAR